MASANFVKATAEGAATNCIARIVIISWVVVTPRTVVPKTPPNAVTVFIPSMKKK